MAERTWVRRAGPLGLLEQDWQTRYGDHAVQCFTETGFVVTRFDDHRIDDGWLYVRLPVETDEELTARSEAYQARTLTFFEEGTSHWEAEVEPLTRANITRMRRSRPRSEQLPSLAKHIDVCLDAAANTLGYLHWIMACGFHGKWQETFAEITGNPEIEAAALVGGLDHASNRLVRDLRKVARLRQQDDAGFDAAFASLLQRWGRRTGKGYGSVDAFSSPTWTMDPSLALAAVNAHARADLDEAARRDRRVRSARRRALTSLRRSLSAAPELLERFERAHTIAVSNVKAMENHNALMEQETAGLLREAVHRAGVALVAAGVVDKPTDVFHLSVAEIAAPPSDVRRLIAERKEMRKRQAAKPPPPFFGPEPPTPHPAPAEAAEASTEPGVLVGVSGSPGLATGRAVVADADALAMPEVNPGDILVARDAGPAWTPIFAVLGGIVLDTGAVSQHAAIVARQLGIPAVLGTTTATTAIANGTTITVDGTQGRVETAV
ncbi:MAG: PEP-utilizing enzyme [Acidimicrobiales bacterium]